MNNLPNRSELTEVARLLATTIDFDALIREGVLEKLGSWYLIRDADRLPKVAMERAYAVKTGPDGSALVRFTSESSRKASARLYRQLTGKRLD